MSLLSQLCSPNPMGSPLTLAIGARQSAHAPAPPVAIRHGGHATPRRSLDQARLLTRLLLSDGNDTGSLASLEAGVDEDVDVWTPALSVRSRFELMRLLDEADDSIGDIVISFTDAEGSSQTAFLGWLATGRFQRPAFLDDDHMLEPDGSVIRLAGATSISFTPGGRADQIRCYYDRLSLIEQLVASRRTSTPG